MAIDWIKMRSDLQSHPKIVRILSATGTDKFRVIGGLHAVWGIFDAHSEDGKLHGYTPDLLDHVIGWEGLARAMESVGWLRFDGLETLTLPDFEAHNGQSAKRRAEDQKRKKNSRHSVRNLSADDADENRTRKEKKRKEEKQEQSASPSGSRLPTDWKPDDEELRWARDARPDLSVPTEVEKFRDYWHSTAGAKGRKTDWKATWRNWIRNAHGTGGQPAKPAKRREML